MSDWVRTLQAGAMPCPSCLGACTRTATAGTRTVRGVGDDRVSITPRRARCGDFGVTQILLPAELTIRSADTTEVIGNA